MIAGLYERSLCGLPQEVRAMDDFCPHRKVLRVRQMWESVLAVAETGDGLAD